MKSERTRLAAMLAGIGAAGVLTAGLLYQLAHPAESESNLPAITMPQSKPPAPSQTPTASPEPTDSTSTDPATPTSGPTTGATPGQEATSGNGNNGGSSDNGGSASTPRSSSRTSATAVKPAP